MKFGRNGQLTQISNSRVINKGDSLPSSLVLPTTSGQAVNLYNLSQKSHLVIFVYPGDQQGLRYGELAGCTLQACAFSNAINEFHRLNTTVFGLSMQSTERQNDKLSNLSLLAN